MRQRALAVKIAILRGVTGLRDPAACYAPAKLKCKARGKAAGELYIPESLSQGVQA